jgi:Uncharacterized protein conserved in bacteria (DUF2188)
MQKLHAVIDNALGAPEKDPPRQVSSNALKDRELAIAEGAKKIDALRLKRLANSPEQPTPLIFEIVRYRGHWRTLHGGRHSSPFPDQAAAIAAAKSLAKSKREMGHAVEVLLRRTDGKSAIQSLD